MSKGKILWLSDSALTTTGYSTISLNILNGMEDKGWDTHWMAHNYVGQTLNKGDIKLSDGTQIKSKVSGAGREQYCKDLILPRIAEDRPDIFCILLDTFMDSSLKLTECFTIFLE